MQPPHAYCLVEPVQLTIRISATENMRNMEVLVSIQSARLHEDVEIDSRMPIRQISSPEFKNYGRDKN